jgi:hypothetical protein
MVPTPAFDGFTAGRLSCRLAAMPALSPPILALLGVLSASSLVVARSVEAEPP